MSKFLSRLEALARVTARDLPKEAFELFDVFVVQPYGEDAALKALGEFVRKSARGFPAPGELIALIEGPQLSPKQIAGEMAAKMIGTISRRGYVWTDTYRYDGHATFEDAVRAELGDEAIGALNTCGGWQRFCAQFDEGANSNSRAQLRDLLEVQVIRKQQGQQPKLDAPRTREPDAIGEFISKQKQLREHNGLREVVEGIVESVRQPVRDDGLPF